MIVHLEPITNVSWAFAAYHSRAGIFQFFDTSRNCSQISFILASSRDGPASLVNQGRIREFG